VLVFSGPHWDFAVPQNFQPGVDEACCPSPKISFHTVTFSASIYSELLASFSPSLLTNYKPEPHDGVEVNPG